MNGPKNNKATHHHTVRLHATERIISTIYPLPPAL